MSTNENDLQENELIDVGDISTDFEDDLTEEREGRPGRATSSHGESQELSIAELKDRFAAFAIDAMLLYLVYWLILFPFRAIALGQPAGPIPASGMYGLIFHSIFLLIAFLFFTLTEFAFQASPGKMLCRLLIRKTDGSQINFGAALIRNLVRPIDLLLIPILIPLALMEWTTWHRRLGDFAAHTVVVKNPSRLQRQFALSLDIVASTSRRAIAFFLDFTLFAAFALGWGLLLNSDQLLISMILVIIFPVAAILFFTLPEWIVSTSPGKWLLGLAICNEDGSGIGLQAALVRNIWRVFDCNPIGFLTSFFSIRHQRPGDTAAGSIVVCAQREWPGAVALAIVIIITAIIGYAGSQNRDNFLSGGFKLNFLPSIDLSGTGRDLNNIRAQNIGLKNFNFAGNSADSIRKPSIFKPGESLFMVFDVEGYGVMAGKAWVQEDLSIRYPDGSVGLTLENINDFNKELPDKGALRFENNISLPETAMPGRYTVTITLRDKIAKREIKEQRFFYITATDSGATSPPAAAPPPAASPPAEQPLDKPLEQGGID